MGFVPPLPVWYTMGIRMPGSGAHIRGPWYDCRCMKPPRQCYLRRVDTGAVLVML